MKKSIFILVLLTCWGLFAEKPIVAVLEIENKTSGKNGLSSDEIELIAELMRSELIQTNEFNVMRKDEMEAAIAQHVKKSHQLNRDSKYAIELGKTISARYIITSKILKDGKKFRISAEMINTEIGSSTRSGNAKFTIDDDDDSKDKAIASLIKQLLGEREESLRPKKSEGQIACEEANAAGSEQKWKSFLKYYADEYPECVPEAKKQLEEIAYHKAERENSVEAWQEYLDEYPLANKRHAIEAEEQIEKLKKAASKQQNQNLNYNTQNQKTDNSIPTSAATEQVGNREWSELSEKKMNFNEAKNYCRKLRDGGNSDWRLPTIDELRTLIQNCPGSETAGACKVSEDEGCLSNMCISERYCECAPKTSGEHSKLGDTTIIWTSSLKTQTNNRAFTVDFLRGGIGSNNTESRYNVRCTR
ncbi:DUF1566 domain-containing protein [bacterium]|nr:DUF1566 domain-containing protein [bacterium]